MSEMRIFLVPYDSGWPREFEQEKLRLEALLSRWRRGPIEHIGSTAVVGLCAKPVIDVMVGVESLADSEPAKAAMQAAGYQYSEYKADVMHWFCKPSFEQRTHHVHLVPFGSPLWRERLKFRDALRAEPRLRVEYEALKRDLAAAFELDRDAYTEAKGPFIAKVLAAP